MTCVVYNTTTFDGHTFIHILYKIPTTYFAHQSKPIVSCRANTFPCQDFLCRAVPRFSVPGRAIDLRVPCSVPCQGVPVFRRMNILTGISNGHSPSAAGHPDT